MRKNKYIILEVIRGFAALSVFLCHLLGIINFFKGNSFYNFLANWGTEAVIIFFILSGVVIHISYKKRQYSAKAFLKNRLIRLYPVYFIGCTLSILVSYITTNSVDSLKVILGNFLMTGTFQDYIVTVLQNNPVVWSLSFEMFFYVFFTLMILVKLRGIKFWIIAGLIAIPVYLSGVGGIFGYTSAMLAFSLLWLLGYYTDELIKKAPKVSIGTAIFFVSLLPGYARLQFFDVYYDVVKYLLYGFIALPIFIYALQYEKKDQLLKEFKGKNMFQLASLALLLCGTIFFSISKMEKRLLYIVIPAVIFLYNFFRVSINLNRLKVLIKELGIFLGKISYALYMIHFPTIIFFNWLFPVHFVIALFSSITVSFGLAFGLEEYLQKWISKHFTYSTKIDPSVKIELEGTLM